MFKKISFMLLATAMMIGPSFADKVYHSESGVWAIDGYANNPDPNDVSCVLSTHWVENQNRININVFPKRNGKFNLTMSIRNDNWDAHSQNKHNEYQGDVVFVNNGLRLGLTFIWQWYPENDYQTIIIRHPTRDFVDLYQKAEEMIFFPNTNDEMRVGLYGSQIIADKELSKCVDVVLGN